MTNEFVIALDPRPGTLATLLSGLAKERINIRGGFGANVGDFDTWHMVVDDEAKAERVLKGTHTRYQLRPVVTATLKDEPGTLLEACERLAARGLNLEAVYTLGSSTPGSVTVAFRVDDPVKAASALHAA